MQQVRKKLILCKREDWLGAALYHIELRGDALRLDGAHHTDGFACLPAVDGGSSGFRWNRVTIGCRLPGDCVLRVRCYCADERTLPEGGTLDERIAALPAAEEPRRAAERLFGAPVAASGDFLLSCSGRYLWLMLELGSADGQSPAVTDVALNMAGDHMTDYLPAIYRAGDFTRRFLSVFDSLSADLEDKIDALPQLLDDARAPEEMRRYLAAWLCLPADCPEAELTERMRGAVRAYETMYTPAGVRAAILRLTGREPLIIESKDVDPNSAYCWEPELYRSLYGDNPYKFFVLLEEDTFAQQKDMERFISEMQALIPAGVEMELVLLKRRIQLGWHSYLGVNAVITELVPAAIDENTTIHYGGMIGGETGE